MTPRGEDWAIFPGSREGELKRLLPVFLDVARGLRAAQPGAVVRLALAPTVSAEKMRQLADDAGRSLDDVVLVEGVLAAALPARACLAASGTVTLELACLGRPVVVAYKVHWLTYWIGRLLVRGVEHMALPNLILGRRALPEHLQDLDADAILADLLRLGSPVKTPRPRGSRASRPPRRRRPRRGADLVASGRGDLMRLQHAAPALFTMAWGLGRLFFAGSPGLSPREALAAVAWDAGAPSVGAGLAAGSVWLFGATELGARALGIVLQSLSFGALAWGRPLTALLLLGTPGLSLEAAEVGELPALTALWAIGLVALRGPWAWALLPVSLGMLQLGLAGGLGLWDPSVEGLTSALTEGLCSGWGPCRGLDRSVWSPSSPPWPGRLGAGSWSSGSAC
ncbi:MAG: hypothetical protein IPI35_21790 [Deltaproteobacteria bacterium]|nr:hypothetical protein [Deltaproteobacteria bacterium]